MKKFVTGVFLILLTGCFSSTPDSRFYLLEADKNIETVSDKKINLAVQDIQVPEYLDRPQIVLQKPDSSELKIAEFDRWAVDLNAMLQNILIEDLQKALPNAEIIPLAYGSMPRYVIKLNIEKIGGWLNGKAYMTGSWQILNRQGKVVFEQNFAQAENAGKSYDSYVQAQGRMLARVADEIARRIVMMK